MHRHQPGSGYGKHQHEEGRHGQCAERAAQIRHHQRVADMLPGFPAAHEQSGHQHGDNGHGNDDARKQSGRVSGPEAQALRDEHSRRKGKTGQARAPQFQPALS